MGRGYRREWLREGRGYVRGVEAWLQGGHGYIRSVGVAAEWAWLCQGWGCWEGHGCREGVTAGGRGYVRGVVVLSGRGCREKGVLRGWRGGAHRGWNVPHGAERMEEMGVCLQR